MTTKEMRELYSRKILEFKPGDVVWVLTKGYRKRSCSFCEGEGLVYVSFKDKNFRTKCPKCFGNKIFISEMSVGIRKAKISLIEIKISLVGAKEKIVLYTEANEEVVCGFKDVFKTENEAKKELERRERHE